MQRETLQADNFDALTGRSGCLYRGELMKKRFLIAPIAVILLTATACSSSKSKPADSVAADSVVETASAESSAAETAATETAAPAAETTAAAAVDTTNAAAADTVATAAAGSGKDCVAKIGFMGPFTGDAASIGQEQLNWGKLGLDDFNAANGTKFTLVETDTQLDPAQATTGAQKLVSDTEVVAVLGPAGSQEVEAIGPAMTTAGLVYVSPSATRTSLTIDGKFTTFARVVPNDDAQGPTIAKFAKETVGATKVMIIDDQTSYSTGLADSVTKAIEPMGVTVVRESIAQKSTDFSSLVAKVTDDVNAVILPWQLAANAQQFGTQLLEQGKKAAVIGSDGVYSPKDFSLEGAYVTSFAPDVRGVTAAAAVVKAYQAAHDDKFGTFGPPVYVGAQLIAKGIAATCKDGKAGARADVAKAVKSTTLDDTILGGPVSLDAAGDVVGAKFYLSKITAGKYVLVP
jgi:branched-chain amino acid transport system substrate-binding protein